MPGVTITERSLNAAFPQAHFQKIGPVTKKFWYAQKIHITYYVS